MHHYIFVHPISIKITYLLFEMQYSLCYIKTKTKVVNYVVI